MRLAAVQISFLPARSWRALVRILLVHNRYKQPGGEDGVLRAEASLLQKHLHQVELFEADNDAIEGPLHSLATAFTCIWSPKSRRKFVDHLNRFEPDIVHIHNFFPTISPAVHHAAHARGIPVIQTLHNYRLICPASTMLRNGRICEKCTHESYPVSAVRYGCYRKSHTASAALANMLVFHRAIGTWTKAVSRFIALSEFSRRTFVKAGLPEERIAVKSNFLADDPGQGTGKGKYILFAGRLVEEKGIACLLEAWKMVRSDMRLIIVGDGDLAPRVREFATRNPSVEWLGFKSRSEILSLMGDAYALVFPSVWYEAFPLVLAESLAKGLPVISSNIGSMPEIITHRKTGMLFTPGSPLDLAITLQWAIDHPSEIQNMRALARREFESKYTAERNYRQLLKIYEEAMPSLADSRLASAV